MAGSIDSVADEVRAVVRELLPVATSPEAVTSGAVLGEAGLGFDSVGLIDLLCDCEDRFGVELPAEILLEDDAGLTVGQLISHVQRRLAERTAPG